MLADEMSAPVLASFGALAEHKCGTPHYRIEANSKLTSGREGLIFSEFFHVFMCLF
jgi:hypothetical protein